MELPVTPTISQPAAIRLRGRWLALARCLWVLIAAFSIGVFLAGLKFSGADSTPIDPQLLQQAGLSIPAVNVFLVVRVCMFALVFGIVGLLTFWFKSDDPLALASSLMLVTFGTLVFPATPFSLARAYPFLQLPIVIFTGLGYALSGYVFYTFPDGRFYPRWTGIVWLAWSLWSFLHLTPGLPAWITRGLLATDPVLSVFFILSFIAVQTYRYRRVFRTVQRQQTKWVVLGLIAAFSGYLIFRFLSWPFANPQVYRNLVFTTIASLFMLLIPLSFGIAIFRYRLWDIDIVINRTLVYGTLTAATMALYLLVVGFFSSLLGKGSNTVIAFLATGLIAILFEPLRGRLQRAVNRFMYGERDDPALVLARLSQQLESTLAPEATLPTIVETVAQAMRFPYVAIAILQPDGEQRIASETGRQPDRLIQMPLIYQSEPVGQLLLAERSPGEALSAADRRLLSIIAQQAGSTLRTVLLAGELRRVNTDLQLSRERLVAAQEEERRRLRRDLHDGIGPTLASLSQRLDTAADLVTRNPAMSITLLGEIKGQVRGTLAEIRRLVYALRPPVLDEFGLVSAVREHIAPYHGPHGLDITMDVTEPLPPLPAAVEVAAYRIILEAFTNVIHHAEANACRITIVIREKDLFIEVADDGKGLLPGTRNGVGLTSMHERAEELGGVCVVEKGAAHGTTVWARLPIRKD